MKKMNQNIPSNTQQQNKITPQPTSGTIPIAGKNIPIAQQSVTTSNHGSKPEQLIKGLKKAVKQGTFKPKPQNE